MKILHTVENYYPSQGGVQEVVKQLSERLVKLGHQVTVATSPNVLRNGKLINGVKVVEFNITGDYIKGYEGEVRKYQQFVLNSNFDIITNFAALRWSTDLVLPILKKIKAAKVFVPTGFSKLYSVSYRKYFGNMKLWLKDYDKNIFLSNNYRDINFARKHGVKNYVVIPNAASEEEFLSAKTTSVKASLGLLNDLIILHVGSHTGFKGHKEAIEIFSKAKIRNSALIFVGNISERGCYRSCQLQSAFSNTKEFLKGSGKKILFPRLDRCLTVDLFKESDLFLFPSNIECSPIVLFEACASKTPFLSTDVGNAREIVRWTGGGVILPTKIGSNGLSHANTDQSARLLEKLISSPSLRQRLAKSGYKNWQNKFTWEKIAQKYNALYSELHK